jgi:Fe2+ transport system protein FeoA
VTLLDLSEGAVVEIRGLRGGAALAERLHAFGFFIGSRVRLVKVAPFRGPLMVEDVTSGARVMIGRGMAGKIEVSYSDPA